MSRRHRTVSAELSLDDFSDDDLIEELEERGSWAKADDDLKILEAVKKQKYEHAFNLLFEKLAGKEAERKRLQYLGWKSCHHLKDDYPMPLVDMVP